MRLQPRESSFLIGTHQSAVTRHVGGENGGQLAFDAFRGQSAPNRMDRIDYRLSEAILMVKAGLGIPFGARARFANGTCQETSPPVAQPLAIAFQFLVKWSAVRQASACAVSVGLCAPLVPITDAPMTPRLGTSWENPQRLTTLVSRLSPIRVPP